MEVLFKLVLGLVSAEAITFLERVTDEFDELVARCICRVWLVSEL